MSAVATHAVVPDAPPPFKTPSFTLRWPDDPEARLHFALKPETAYVLFLQRGRTCSGSELLRQFQAVAESRRIKVLDVDFASVGFWEKMLERGLVHDWGMDNPKILL